MRIYESTGLVVESEIPLPCPPVEMGDMSRIDVTVFLGNEIDPPYERPSPHVIAEYVVGNRIGYTICRVPSGYVIRLPRVADFAIDADAKRVVCHPVVAGISKVIPIILAGTITAFLLAMRGRCVLHGSAVEVDGKGVAFVGMSGQGKSTMAAIFCSAGANFVADDVLVVDFDQNGSSGSAVYALRSGREIRLREKAASLAEHFEQSALRRTEDDRIAVAASGTAHRKVPLTGIVLPRPNHNAVTVSATRMKMDQALLALGRCERIEGWQGRDHLRQQFLQIGRIVESLPICEVTVPWGPPFADDLMPKIVMACENEGMAILGATRKGPF